MSWLIDIVRDVAIGLSEAALRQFGKKTEARPWVHPHFWAWLEGTFPDGIEGGLRARVVQDPRCLNCEQRKSTAPERCPGPKGWK